MRQMKIYYKLLLFFPLFLIAASCSEILMEQDISDKTVVLVAPTNNVQLFSTGVTFTWDAVEDATKYTLQIAKPNFTNPTQILLDTTITGTSFTQQLPIGTYEWRVSAANESYNTAFTTRSITIGSNDDFQGNTVVLTSPVNNLITNVTAQSLSWNGVIGTTSYNIQVYDASNSLIVNEDTTNTVYNYSFSEGSYQWRVRATNGAENTLYSTRSALIDLTVPNTPTLTSPANMSISPTSDVTFLWSRASIGGSAENDTIYIYTNSTLTNLFSSNQVTSPYTLTLPSGTYYWRVKASDAAGNAGNPSNIFSVIVN